MVNKRIFLFNPQYPSKIF